MKKPPNVALVVVLLLPACSQSATPAASPSTNAFDGQWFASVPPQGKCDFLSHLTIDVAGPSLSGRATNLYGVFRLSGMVDAAGSGSFKIGAYDGKIEFSGETFEADYANNCGPRHAVGTKVTAQIPAPASDPSLAGDDMSGDVEQKLSKLATLATRKVDRNTYLDICAALDLLPSNPGCKFYGIVSRPGGGNAEIFAYYVFPEPDTALLRIVLMRRASLDAYYYLLSADGKLDRAIHVGGDKMPRPLAGDEIKAAALSEAKFWTRNLARVEELLDRPDAR